MDMIVAASAPQPVAMKDSSVDLSAKDSVKQEFSEVYNQEMPNKTSEAASNSEQPKQDDELKDQVEDTGTIAAANGIQQAVAALPLQATHITLQSLVADSIASNDSSIEDFSDVELDIVVCKQEPSNLSLVANAKASPEQLTEMTELATTQQAISEVVEPAMNNLETKNGDFADEMLQPIVMQQTIEQPELETNLLSLESTVAELIPQEIQQESTPQIVNHITNHANSAAKPALPQQVAVHVPVTDNSWREAFSEKVLWLTNQNIKSASVQLNPVELGPIEVNIKMNQQQASIVVNAQHGATREALGDAMPNLRGLLADNGIQLQDFQIQDGKDQQGRHQEAFYQRDEDVGFANELIEPAVEAQSSKVVVTRLNAIDYYA